MGRGPDCAAGRSILVVVVGGGAVAIAIAVARDGERDEQRMEE